MEEDVRESWRKIHGVRVLTKGEWLPAVFAILRTGPMHYTDIFAAIRSLEIGNSARRSAYSP